MLLGMSLTCSSSYRVTLVVLWSANRARSGSSLELWALAKVVLYLTFLVCMPECLSTRTGSMRRSPPTSQASLRSTPMVLMVTWASAVMGCLPLRQPLSLQLHQLQLSHVRFLQVIRSQKNMHTLSIWQLVQRVLCIESVLDFKVSFLLKFR